ncbi:MAG: hypothetical protein NW226_14525 [Microscillaceae bacterium]|nr:hypothetical protein [Microscillaceae bacterium]
MKQVYQFIYLGVFMLHFQVSAQHKVIKERSLVTNKELTITVTGDYKDAIRTPTRKNYISLYKRDANKLLLGNPCAEEKMRELGFKYVVVPRNFQMSGSRYFFHNMWANTKLFFRNGPFWKSRLRNKVEKCRQQTHDFVD